MTDQRTQQILQFIGANVRRLRREQGLTQQALAERGAIDPLYVQRIERAAVNGTISKLVRLADALGVPPGQLMSPVEGQVRPHGRPRSETRIRRKR